MRRVLDPDGSRVTFDAFASAQSVSRLADFFEKRLTARGMTRERSRASWQLPAGSTAPRRTLTVTPPQSQGHHQACTEPVPNGARSIVVLTRID